jgi:hypothetical protein
VGCGSTVGIRSVECSELLLLCYDVSCHVFINTIILYTMHIPSKFM